MSRPGRDVHRCRRDGACLALPDHGSTSPTSPASTACQVDDARPRPLSERTVFRRPGRAGAPSGTSNEPFGRWGEVFGDDVVGAAMIDRLVHHAEVIALKGDSYRLRNRDLGHVPTASTDQQ